MNILIIEDDAGLSELLRDMLENSGNKIECLHSAKDGLIYLKNKLPDMMLLDYGLHDMNGIELINEINLQGISLPPFAVITGQGNERIAIDMMKLGARDYIMKDTLFLDLLPGVINRIKNEINNERALDQANKNLIESEHKYRSLFERDDDAVFIYDPDTTNILEANNTTSKMYGYDSSELIGMSCLKFSAEVENSKRAINKIREDGDVFVPIRYHQKKDGTKFAVEINGYSIKIGGKDLMHAVVRDITDRQKAEQALRQSEENFRSLVGNIPGISYRCRCDENWTMEFISDEVEKISGYPASDFLQNIVRSWASILHPEDKQAAGEFAMEKVGRKEPYTLEFRIIDSDGNIRWCYEKGKGVFDEHGKLCYLDGVIVDITELKRAESEKAILEEQLYRSQKMETIGTLAGGITHEINQPLNAISVSSNSILYWQRNNPNVLPDIFIEELHQISKGAKRIDEIIRHMRSFWVADNTSQKKPNSLNEVVEDALSLIEQQSSAHGIIIEKNFSEQEIVVLSERVSLEQIVINLMVNAMHSLDESGCSDKKIIIETKMEELSCYLSISDNGTGLPEGEENMVFSPFYSTKNPENSMGLGLAIVKNMVNKMDGSILATNNNPRGAIFKITFPNEDDAA